MADSDNKSRFGLGLGTGLVLGILVGASGMFFGRSYHTGQWPFEHRKVEVPAVVVDPANNDESKPPVSVTDTRPASWAKREILQGLPNFHKVSDELYRGAQPDDDAMYKLKEMGIKTVVNLRQFHSDRNETGDVGLGYVSIKMTAMKARDKYVIEFLQTVSNKTLTPVFVHCKHGSDRTGLMCAIYRIFIQGWSKEQALQEMRHGGYGFHEDFENLLRYIKELDVEKVREEAGI